MKIRVFTEKEMEAQRPEVERKLQKLRSQLLERKQQEQDDYERRKAVQETDILFF